MDGSSRGAPVRSAFGILPQTRSPLEVLQDHLSCDAPGCSDHTSPGLGCRPAQREPGEWSAVAGPPGHRTEAQDLIGRNVALEDVPAREAQGPFYVDRRDDLGVSYDLPRMGGQFLKGPWIVPASSGLWSSQDPSPNRYGAYCTKQVMVCFPGGATEGSRTLWNRVSLNGWEENRPYFASSNAWSS